MTRLSIEITAPAPDDFMGQATILIGAKPELDALVAKLESLGVKPTSNAGFIREIIRKGKAPIPGSPGGTEPGTVSGPRVDMEHGITQSAETRPVPGSPHRGRTVASGEAA